MRHDNPCHQRLIGRAGRAVARLARMPMFIHLAAVAALLLIGIEAAARSGGGQNYTGGGSNGGSGTGGDGGGGDGLVFLVYLIVAHPKIGIPVALVVIGYGAVSHLRNPDRSTAKAVRSLEGMASRPSADLAGIAARDPGFDAGAFLEKARSIEVKVQTAWTAGDMAPVRRFLSDGLMRRFETQLHIMKGQGIRNVMADHAILDARIHAVESDAHFDAIHVAIEASARDIEVALGLSDAEATAMAKRAPAEPYVEIWSFLRRPGAKTAQGRGVLGGRCPSCGADLGPGQAVRCDHCRALVNSGRYDWVLSEITQAEEWRPSATGSVRGLAALKQLDPAFNRQAAEDRASYLFWRWIESLATGSPAPLAKVASRPFKEQVAQATRGGPGSYFKVAVGAVDLIGCEVDVDGRDRYHARVLWSSARSQRGQPTHMANVVSMGRRSGAVTETESGVSHAHCPECHGPLTENDDPSCDYCGAALDAGEKEWVLEAVIQPEELVYAPEEGGGVAVESFLPDMGDRRERTLLLMRMAAVVMADGEITKPEMRLLRRAAKRWQIPFDAVTPILNREAELDQITTLKPANPPAFFGGLIAAALVDGRIDAKERRLLLDVARSLDIPEAEAVALMKRAAAASSGRRN